MSGRMSRAAVLLLGVSALGLAVWVPGRTVQAATTRPVLKLSGSQLLQGLATTWQATLTTTPSAPVDLSLGMTGGPAGRQSAIEGVNDAAISPTGFSADDLEEIAGLGKSPDDFVTVPIAAQALVWAELPPRQSLERPIAPNDINVFDTKRYEMPRAQSFTSAFAISSLFLNVFPFSNEYIAAHGVLPHTYVPDADGNDVGWTTAAPFDFVGVSTQNNYIRQPHRAGASTQAWMLERYTKEKQPAVWTAYIDTAAAGTTIRRDQPSEIPFWRLDAASTAGGTDATAGSIIDQTMSVVLSAATPRLITTNCCLFGGIPGWAAAKYENFLLDNPDQVKFPSPPAGASAELIDQLKLKVVPIDDVAPTAANIAKAVSNDVGLATPLPGPLPSANGGYPFSYVNSLIVPAKGIGVVKANAMAAFIRWAVTDGQKTALVSQTNDAPLPPFHVARALKAANDIVTRNCAATRLKVDGNLTVAGETIDLQTCGPPTQAAAATTTTTTTVGATTTTTVAATTTTSTTAAPTSVGTVATPAVNSGGATTNRPRATTATTRSQAGAATSTTAPAAAAAVTTVAGGTTTTTAKAKAKTPSSSIATQSVSAFVPEVDRAPRQRSYVLQAVLGALAFWLGTWLARRRERWAVAP